MASHTRSGRRPGHPLPEPLPTPPAARATHARIVALLQRLTASASPSPLAREFRRPFREFLSLLGQFQRQVVAGSGRRVSCRRGCAACCLHWVEDVNSFEAEIIAAHIRRRLPAEIAGIVAACRADVAAMERLEALTTATLRKARRDLALAATQIEQVDLMLASFYQLRRPCPLLDARGECRVYRLRPLTCRVYCSFSAPRRCDPAYINDDDVPTCLINVGEDASSLLDGLHFRHDRSGGDTGLRSLLVKLLDGGA
jgi:Fe-S-cluster containining protein